MERYRDRMKQAILAAMDHAVLLEDEETALALALVMRDIAADEKVGEQASRSLATLQPMHPFTEADSDLNGELAWRRRAS